MTTRSPRRRRFGAAALATLAATLLCAPAASAQAPAAAASAPAGRSALDAALFYQLLLGELELRGGDVGDAYEVMLDAARRTRDDAIFLRAIEIALHARAGEQALSAARAWRSANPRSIDALRYEAQILIALNRTQEAVDPLQALIEAAPVVERPGLIGALPRMFQRAVDRRQAAALMERVLEPWLAQPATRTASRISIGRAWLAAGDTARALELASHAQADDAGSPGAALLALEMLPGTTAAEPLVLDYLEQPQAEPAVRLAYVRMLTASQRYADAVKQLQRLTAARPDMAAPWLSLGALWLELREPAKADEALQRFVQLAQAAPTPDPGEQDDEPAHADDRALVQAWLMLAQAAEQRGDYAAAERWLAHIDSPQRALEVQSRRASLLVRQGKLEEARALIAGVPERSPEDARAKLVTEAQLLREAKRWSDALDVLASANKRFPDDPDLLYEQAMTAEKLNRIDDMERLLKRVIALKPDHQHAYNALGYSLADRNLRLPEARELISKALELAPGDPFITDSLGWLEYREGNRAEALRHLKAAYGARPDTEIAAHLAEVLWVDGQRDEARRILREASSRDGANDVLRETISRLKVDL